MDHRGQAVCPLLGVCPLIGVSIIGGFTVLFKAGATLLESNSLEMVAFLIKMTFLS